jgi:thiosulfate reductase/polysulfide reductase chain A
VSAVPESANERIVPTFCHGCGSYKPNCGVLCHVRDGRFVRVEGNPAALNNGRLGSTSLCAKGYTGPQYVYASDRLMYPLKRTGAKGEGRFERISWDEALDTIAAKLKETKSKYGPESYGVLSPEAWPVLSTLGRRFLNVHGSPNYMHSAICHTPRAAAAKATIGFMSRAPDDWLKTKLIVNWGANVENSGVNQGMPNAILDALAHGTRMIDIRPMLDPLGAKADIWLPVRPGTDCALALAFLNVLIGEELYDAEFVADWCHGFDELAKHARRHPPEWAAPITGISAERIREAARLIGTTKPVFIKFGNGIGDQARDGTSTVSAVCLIAAITGNLDVPGGYCVGLGAGGSSPRPTMSTLPELAPADLVEKLIAPETPRWYQAAGHSEGGPTSAYYKGLMSVLTGDPYPLRVLNASCSNPLSATRNPKKIAEALKKLDFMFVMDTFRASHVDFADIVLPACTGYEQDDYFSVRRTGGGIWIAPYNRVIEPLGESRTDWRFYLDLAVRMGYGDHFWNGNMRACMDEMLAPFGVTSEELRQHPDGMAARLPAPRAGASGGPEAARPSAAQQYRRYSMLFKDLPHGKVQCNNEFIGGKENSDGTGTLPYLPVYLGPPEGIAETPELTGEYPLVLSDVHAHRLSHHSFMHDVPYLRELQPYPWIKINPATARKYGIADGDWMRVESPHGWSRFKAEYFEGISPEVLMTKRGWWQSCQELDLPGYAEYDGGSEVNNLYNADMALFDTFHSQMPKQTLVKISRWDEAATSDRRVVALSAREGV